MINYQKILKSSGALLQEKSPVILSGIAIAGVVTTSYLAVTATPKALWILDCKRDEIMGGQTAEEVEFPAFSLKERIQYAWRPYVPAFISGVATVSAIALAQSINNRRLAALAGLYTISEKALTEYRDKIVDTLGEPKEEKIRTEIAEDHIRKNPPKDESLIMLNDGEQLCYDDLTGRYFKSNINDIKAAQNNANALIISDGFLTLNEFNDFLGLKYVGMGDEVGWSENHMIDIFFSSHLTADGRPCLSVEHRVRPKLARY